MARFGSLALASFLLDVHVPRLPPPEQVCAHALELECGHEEFWLESKTRGLKPAPEQVACPVAWNCSLSKGRIAVRYLTPGEPKPKYANLGIFCWDAELVCGHSKSLLRHEWERFTCGEMTRCLACRPGDGADVQITAIGKRLPDYMIRHWAVELSCGHNGTDYLIPVEHSYEPAGFRAAHPLPDGLSCHQPECDLRHVMGIRRLGLIGKLGVPKSPPAVGPDLVTSEVNELRRRLTKAQQQELIRLLEAQQ